MWTSTKYYTDELEQKTKTISIENGIDKLLKVKHFAVCQCQVRKYNEKSALNEHRGGDIPLVLMSQLC